MIENSAEPTANGTCLSGEDLGSLTSVLTQMGLPQDKLLQLLPLAEDAKRWDAFDYNRMIIAQNYYEGCATIDFMEYGDGPQFKSKTARIVMALDALENYLILVEAGLLSKPSCLYGETNPEMAKVAKKVGFKETDGFYKTPESSRKKILRYKKKARQDDEHVVVKVSYQSLLESVMSMSPELKAKLRQRARTYPGIVKKHQV